MWYGLTWSLELYQQTNARLWRQGQKAETVVIHHLVTEGTIDERILQALKWKDQSQDRLIEAVKAQLASPRGEAVRQRLTDEVLPEGRMRCDGGAA